MICFNSHRDLCQSEENKCILKHGKDGVVWPLHTIFTVCSDSFIFFWLTDLCGSQNISIKFLCVLLVYLCLSSADRFIFSIRVSPFYSYFYAPLSIDTCSACVHAHFIVDGDPFCTSGVCALLYFGQRWESD